MSSALYTTVALLQLFMCLHNVMQDIIGMYIQAVGNSSTLVCEAASGLIIIFVLVRAVLVYIFILSLYSTCL